MQPFPSLWFLDTRRMWCLKTLIISSTFHSLCCLGDRLKFAFEFLFLFSACCFRWRLKRQTGKVRRESGNTCSKWTESNRGLAAECIWTYVVNIQPSGQFNFPFHIFMSVNTEVQCWRQHPNKRCFPEIISPALWPEMLILLWGMAKKKQTWHTHCHCFDKFTDKLSSFTHVTVTV